MFDNPWHGEALTRMIDPQMPFRENYDRVISVTSDGNLLGGVIYDGYLKRSIQMHVASRHPSFLSHDLLWVAFDYPFNQLGVDMVYSPIQSTNPHALQFNLRLGFQHEHTLKGAVEGGDLIINVLYRAQCRWLNRKPRTIRRALDA